MKKTVLLFFVIPVIFSIFFLGCYKDQGKSNADVPIPPFNSPVWSPDGSLLGFNHIPIKGNPGNGFLYIEDSSGFWLVNKDGSDLRLKVNFQLLNPAWSPDGKWIAFANGGKIRKMPFDGQNFDTTAITILSADNSKNFFPAWNTTGDSIYYQSDFLNTSLPYHIFKMAADGTGQSVIGNKGLDSVSGSNPFYTTDNQILHVRGDSKSYYIFSMDTNGDNLVQLTEFSGELRNVGNPTKFLQKVYYEDIGVWMIPSNSKSGVKIIDNSTQGYSISNSGQIAFVNFSKQPNSPVDRTHSCIWLANADGSNQRLFVPNNY